MPSIAIYPTGPLVSVLSLLRPAIALDAIFDSSQFGYILILVLIFDSVGSLNGRKKRISVLHLFCLYFYPFCFNFILWVLVFYLAISRLSFCYF
uniref:Uncharacterized protein n=1 Tax=Rhizophora mucronata TaxID=61149 RepID=A0A2P2K1Z3_RHIMU